MQKWDHHFTTYSNFNQHVYMGLFKLHKHHCLCYIPIISTTTINYYITSHLDLNRGHATAPARASRVGGQRQPTSARSRSALSRQTPSRNSYTRPMRMLGWRVWSRASSLSTSSTFSPSASSRSRPDLSLPRNCTYQILLEVISLTQLCTLRSVLILNSDL